MDHDSSPPVMFPRSALASKIISQSALRVFAAFAPVNYGKRKAEKKTTHAIHETKTNKLSIKIWLMRVNVGRYSHGVCGNMSPELFLPGLLDLATGHPAEVRGTFRSAARFWFIGECFLCAKVSFLVDLVEK